MIQGKQISQSFVYDNRLLFSVLLLVGIGIVMVYSASSAFALKKFGTDYYFLKKQVVFAMVGIVALISFSHFPYRLLNVLSYPLLIIALSLLIAILIPGVGYEAGGATRWLRFKDLSFQPAEFARLALIIYLAGSISKKKDKIKDISIGFMPHVMVLFVFSALIVVQPDFGTVIILGIIAWAMMFAGGVPFSQLILSFTALVPVAFIVLVQSNYRILRIKSFLDPWQYSQDKGYQIVHSLMAFGTGGLWGSGLGEGYQKLFYLPEPHTDFIFSVIGEELGLFGVYVILGLFVLILYRGISIAKNTDDRFGAILALGLTVSIGLQAFTNMGVALGLLPTKGLTLPFLSYGGTSLVMNMTFIGILMNIGASQTK
jgi:cell division protein FtsW